MKNIIGVSADGLVKVFEIRYDIEDQVVYQFRNEIAKVATIHYDESDAYFFVGQMKYYFNEIMRMEKSM